MHGGLTLSHKDSGHHNALVLHSGHSYEARSVFACVRSASAASEAGNFSLQLTLLTF